MVIVAESRVADVEETNRSAAGSPSQTAFDADLVVAVAQCRGRLRLVSGMGKVSNVSRWYQRKLHLVDGSRSVWSSIALHLSRQQPLRSSPCGDFDDESEWSDA